MNTYISETGYEAKERLDGIDIYDSNGDYICALEGLTLDHFRDENDNISDEQLEDEIRATLDAEEFLDYQAEYC